MQYSDSRNQKILKTGILVIATMAILAFAVFVGQLINQNIQEKQHQFDSYDTEAVREEAAAEEPAAATEEPSLAGSSSKYKQSVNAKYGQKLIRHASLVLSVGRGEARAKLDKTIDITEKIGGYVLSSNLIQGEEGEVIANVSVRIPESKLKSALETFSNLGKMISRDISAEDVTMQVVDLEARQRHLKSTETALLKLMEKASTVKDILSVQQELSTVQGELEQIKSQLDVLNEQVSFATVNVEFKEPRIITSPTDWGISGAIGQAIRSFITTAASLIIIFGGALPVLIIIILPIAGWLLWRKYR